MNMKPTLIQSTIVSLIAATFVAATYGAEMTELQTDVCIVGGGSGGYAAAIGAARAGANVILVEKQDRLGGTSVNAYVCNWEPGVSGPLAREIYDRLAKIGAAGVTMDHNADRKKGPFGLWLITPTETYEQTLRRAANPVRSWRAVVFDPDKLVQTVSAMLAETKRCKVMLETTFVEAVADGKRVESIKIVSKDGKTSRIKARIFIDSTGGAHLCRKLGCETMLGPDAKSRFDEPSAPDKPGQTLNAISLCYRIRKSDRPLRQTPPDPPVSRYPRGAHVTEVPGGDRILNPLAMVPGRMLIDKGYDATLAECRRIAQAHWRSMQENPTFSMFELHSLAPMLGIRESYRVVGEYVLTQNDLLATIAKQTHPDVTALADHSMDVHGKGAQRVHGELKGPYGIPYRCLIPKGWENLLVACRGASFSHIAASSCRLSRTMIQLGRAAGAAAAMAAKDDVPVREIDVAALQKQLGIPASAMKPR
ncbi:MAG: FAD-dependent oxidoreductase [Phycisphaerae bacterium]|nr:FAD-dependent oxidoreductase [Phycisphaerae bacterium]